MFPFTRVSSFILLVGALTHACPGNEHDIGMVMNGYCVDCHSADDAQAGIRFDNLAFDDSESEQETLERALVELRSGRMPPKDAEELSSSAKTKLIEQLHGHLLKICQQQQPAMRSLTRREYEQSIRSIFGIEFEAPTSLPQQLPAHGFDNQINSLILSSPLLEAYYESAIQIADRLLPPGGQQSESFVTEVPPDQLVISYSSGALVDGALRLAARTDQMWRSCTWPQNFEAQQAGTYRLTISASQFGRQTKHWGKFDGVMNLQIRARSLNEKDGENLSKQRLLAEFGVDTLTPKRLEAVVELYPHETPVLYFSNAPIDGVRGANGPFGLALQRMFANDKRLFAGWQNVKHSNGLRGGIGWDRVKKIRDSADLKLEEVDASEASVAKLLAKMTKNPGLYAETVVYQFYEDGPALEIHDLAIDGPLELIRDPQQSRDQLAADALFGELGAVPKAELGAVPKAELGAVPKAELGAGPKAELGAGPKAELNLGPVLERFLTRAFRRPATDAEIESYRRIALSHRRSGHSQSEAWHLIVRTVLVSPHFLFREHRLSGSGPFELANRLSFFLTGGPADEELNALAKSNAIDSSATLETQALRLLKSAAINSFVDDFTGQWLNTHELADIMPDPRLFPNITDAHIQSMRAESKRFFEHALTRNLPLEHLIAPEFTFVDRRLAEDVYEFANFQGKAALQKTPLPADSPFGGLLGQAAIMMATANGVDTQPVVRGTWVLENILGTPPPPPPENVPALTPNTASARSLREQMKAHKSDENCASCHRKIDPLGFVLENFDAVGRWRKSYQRSSSSENDGQSDDLRVESQVTFESDVEFSDVRDLKAYVVENIDQFGLCLAGKFLSYATGRRVNYRDKLELQQIVQNNLDQQAGLRDLLVAVILSNAFRR